MGGLNCYTMCTSTTQRSTSRTRPSARCSPRGHGLVLGDCARFGKQSESPPFAEGRHCVGRESRRPLLVYRFGHALRRIVFFSLRNCKRATAECEPRGEDSDLSSVSPRPGAQRFEFVTTYKDRSRGMFCERNTRDGRRSASEVGDHFSPPSPEGLLRGPSSRSRRQFSFFGKLRRR